MEASSRAIWHKSASLSVRIFYMAQTSRLVLVLVCPLISTMGGSKEKVTATVAGNCTWHTQIDAATLTEQTW